MEEERGRGIGNPELRSPPAAGMSRFFRLLQSLDTTLVSYSGLLLTFPLCGVVRILGSGGKNGGR